MKSEISQEENVNDDNQIDAKTAEKKLVRKTDTRLLPFLSFMYLFSSLDRSTLGEKNRNVLQYASLTINVR